MIIKKKDKIFLLEPQTAIDFVFLNELIESGCVIKAIALSLLSLSLKNQPLVIGDQQQKKDKQAQCIN